MGHVNHGKTSLLDYIRKSNLISLEYGNITQHMGIYNVKLNNNKTITLIDTPGHESFLSIRRRGIKISDIVLIVISVDKGIMNQTIESINHAKNDNLPIIFIFSKIDKVKNIKFNIDKIKNNLKKLNINLNIKNDKYLYQKISIKTGYGIEKLINKINILSKKLNLLTNINTLNCYGIIIESYLDKKKGYLVKILVQKGILRVGDYIISNFYYGKIKNIFNDYNIKIKKVYPSYPAIIIGFNGPPFSGSKFIVLKKNYKNYIKNIINNNKLLINKKKKKKKNNNKIINIILKADVDSSISVILDEINKFDNINIVNQSIGNINQSDINLATIFNCIIIGFNIKININKKKKINNKNNIYIFNVIYDIIKFLNNKINNNNNLINNYKIISKSKVIKIFKIKKKKIYGCLVLNGKINKNNNINILRNNKIIFKGKILSLRIFNKNVIEVKKNKNFGIIIKNFNNLNIDDIIESYK